MLYTQYTSVISRIYIGLFTGQDGRLTCALTLEIAASRVFQTDNAVAGNNARHPGTMSFSSWCWCSSAHCRKVEQLTSPLILYMCIELVCELIRAAHEETWQLK